jgi:hypothetical protein
MHRCAKPDRAVGGGDVITPSEPVARSAPASVVTSLDADGEERRR